MEGNMIFYSLMKYNNLKGITYNNNKLTYQGKTIDTTNIPIKNFFENSYSQMYIDQYVIKAEDFFNIMDIHAKKIEPREIQQMQLTNDQVLLKTQLQKYGKNIKFNGENEEKYDVINSNHYFELLSKDTPLTKDEVKLLSDYETYISELITYNDYLLPAQNNELNDYKNKIILLSNIEEGVNQEQLNDNQKKAIDTYNQMNKIILSKLNMDSKSNNFEKTKVYKKGYINSIIILFTILLSGILIGTTLFFNIKH